MSRNVTGDVFVGQQRQLITDYGFDQAGRRNQSSAPDALPPDGGHVMTITAQKVNATAISKQMAKVQPFNCSIGAEVTNINLGAASRDQALMEEVRSLLLQHKVLFFRDQEITRAEHVAFAS